MTQEQAEHLASYAKLQAGFDAVALKIQDSRHWGILVILRLSSGKGVEVLEYTREAVDIAIETLWDRELPEEERIPCLDVLEARMKRQLHLTV